MLTDRIIQHDLAGCSGLFRTLWYVCLPPLQVDVPNLFKARSYFSVEAFPFIVVIIIKRRCYGRYGKQRMKKTALDLITLKRMTIFLFFFAYVYFNIDSITLYVQFSFLFFPLVYQMYFSKWQECFLYSPV